MGELRMELELPLGDNIEFYSFMGRHAVNTLSDVIDVSSKEVAIG